MELLEFLKVPTVYVIAAACLLVFTGVSYLALKSSGILLKVLVLLAVLVVPGLFGVALIEQLSHPKPLSYAWLKHQGEKGVRVLKPILDPPRSIHLWLLIENEPRAFFVPWSEEMEQELMEAMERWQNGKNGQLLFRFEPSLDDQKPTFDVMPWPAEPEKEPTPPKEPRRLPAPGMDV